MVVIALLGALMLLGFLFLTLTMQEETNSEYFAQSYNAPAEQDPDVFFNWALEQLIVGPPDTARNSMLYGGYKSILPNMVGADLTPFNGTGIGTVWNPSTARPELDLNRDGVVDGGDQYALQLTHAPGSQIGTLADPATLQTFYANMRNPAVSRLPAPDADYTYPDLNSAFLSYTWTEPVTGRQITIPSWVRPQLLRNRIGANDYLLDPNVPGEWTPMGGTSVHPWYTDPATLPFVMTPHSERRAVAIDPENPANFGVAYEDQDYARRFVSDLYPDTVPTTDPSYVEPFDFGIGREPIWRRGRGDDPAMSALQAYADSYPADPDNDGINDAIWLDLDFPIQNVGDGGGQFVPLYAMKIVDVDALFNLNKHGNGHGSYADVNGDGVDDSTTLIGPHFRGSTNQVPLLSQSNTGRSPHEVNPQYALSGDVDPANVEAFTRFFDAGNWTGGADQSRNLEWWFLLHGRTTFKDDPRGGALRVPDDLLVGRYGEPDRLETGAYRVAAGDPKAAAYFPYPGLSANSLNGLGAGDDNFNAFEGMGRPLPGLVYGGARGYNAGNTLTMTALHEGVPTDRRGSGLTTDARYGLRRLFLADTNVAVNGGGASQAEDGNVRFRFPTLMNAVLPLFPAGGAAVDGFNNVGGFSTIRNWFAATALHEGRTFANRAYAPALNGAGQPIQGTQSAVLTGRGAAGGSLVRPDNGDAAAVADGTTLPADAANEGGAPSLYAAGVGQANAIRQFNRLQIDDPGEMIVDFELAQTRGSADAQFSPAETARLHLTDADYRIARTDSRVLQLAPVSFQKAPGHEAIRRRFTTVSWDVTTAAAPFDPPGTGFQSPGAAEREWQYTGNAGSGAGVVRQFPPSFDVAVGAANDPFRESVRSILGQAARNVELNTPAGKRALRRLIRKLSFNQVSERVTNPADPLFDATADGGAGQGELRLRTLTPHPTDLAAAQVVGPAGHPAAADYVDTTGGTPRFGISEIALRAAAGGGNGNGLLTWDFGNLTGQAALRAQEWHARRDRQNLARDIYVLLYTVGGVETDATATPPALKDYTATNASFGIYTEDQLREMAQLAVNIVDAVDPDPVRTLFVYDKNLFNGYTAYDDGYVNPPGPADTGRGLVAGVERQELALSEVMANVTWAESGTDGDGALFNHPLTEWDDAGVSSGGAPHDFLFVELAYTGPSELNFAQSPITGAPGENYRIVVRDPSDARQFRTDPGAGAQTGVIRTRAITPRAGKLTAARPIYTVANADDEYVTGMAFNSATARSRMRVNLEVQKASVTPVDAANWITLAPQPFADNARQTDPGEVLRDVTPGNAAQILDTLVTGDPANPNFRVQHLNNDLTVTALADPAAAEPNDLFSLTTAPAAKQYANAADVPVVEVLLQTRLNPLRRPKASDPAAANFAEQDEDNPWITVDRTRVVTTRLDIFEDDDNDGVTVGDGTFGAHFVPVTPAAAAAGPIAAAGGTNEAPKLASRVRMEPLLRASELAAVGRTNAERSLLNASPRTAEYGRVVFNSLGGHDRNSPGGHAGYTRPFLLWQPHFDRDFAGPADLIGVPLYDAESLTGLTAPGDRAFGSGISLIKKAGLQEIPTLTTQHERQIGLGYDPDPQDATQQTGPGHDAVLNEFVVAGSRVLYPDVSRAPWQAPLGAAGTTEYLNSWYRLLQYVGTPRRTMEMTDAAAETVAVGPTARLGTDGAFDVGAVRQAGRINFNTLRDPHGPAGLFDDRRVHGEPNGLTATLPMTAPAFTPAADAGLGPFYQNDLYRSLLLSRDGLDPLAIPGVWGDGTARAVLPGVALRGLSAGGGIDGHPFGGFHAPTRSVAGSEADVSQRLREAMQFTPLRLRPQADAWIGAGASLVDADERTSLLPRAFFGVGAADINAATAEGGANPADLDFTTRYRLLNKVLNSATHRSNVFLCWVQVDYFQARELTGVVPDDGDASNGDETRQRIVRIGARRGDSPRYRGVFLIDRSKVPALLRADHLPETSASGENTYSFARDPLSGGAKFSWQDLIIHRQRIQ